MGQNPSFAVGCQDAMEQAASHVPLLIGYLEMWGPWTGSSLLWESSMTQMNTKAPTTRAGEDQSFTNVHWASVFSHCH